MEEKKKVYTNYMLLNSLKDMTILSKKKDMKIHY